MNWHWGRVQGDPIGYGDGANLYRDVGNSPTNWVDPGGLQAGQLYSFVPSTPGLMVEANPQPAVGRPGGFQKIGHALQFFHDGQYYTWNHLWQLHQETKRLEQQLQAVHAKQGRPPAASAPNVFWAAIAGYVSGLGVGGVDALYGGGDRIVGIYSLGKSAWNDPGGFLLAYLAQRINDPTGVGTLINYGRMVYTQVDENPSRGCGGIAFDALLAAAGIKGGQWLNARLQAGAGPQAPATPPPATPATPAAPTPPAPSGPMMWDPATQSLVPGNLPPPTSIATPTPTPPLPTSKLVPQIPRGGDAGLHPGRPPRPPGPDFPN